MHRIPFALCAALFFAAPISAQPPSRVTLEMEIVGEGAPRGGLMPLDVFAQIERTWHINYNKPTQKFLIATDLHLELPAGVTHEAIEYPPPERRKFAFAGDETLLVYEGKLGLTTAIRTPADFKGDQVKIDAKLRYQACNDTTCLPPMTAQASIEVPVVAASAAVIDEGDLHHEPQPRSASAQGGDRFERWLTERGLLFTLLAVAVLGLGLNLTPCVYPLISVTIAYFGRQAAGRGRLTLLAAVYVIGIALSFSVLGVGAALSGGLFGAALQKPVVVLFIAAVMITLALSSFGLYQLQPPAALMRWAGGAGSGMTGALFMGLTMGIVAAPCVGPIVLGLLVFVGSRQDALLGFALFFALALGMGFPYLGLAAAAGSIKTLPRSGEWLAWTERVFGCILLAMAGYFVSPLLPLPWRLYLVPVIVATSGAYLGFFDRAGNALRLFPHLKRAIGAAMVAFAFWLAQPEAVHQAIAWEPLAAVAADSPPAGKPVLIDFAAEWCIPCREMDHTTYVHPDVVREAGRFRMVKADITEENPDTRKVVERYDVRGVPTVILLDPVGAEKQRLVGYVGPEEMLDAMRQVSG
jgi:thiol:disulfide interchange protein DsbD